MEAKELRSRLEQAVPGRVCENEPMHLHTSFRVGGAADFFVTPASIEESEGVVQLCEVLGIPYYIVGNGSNLLVGDGGIRGVVIQTQKELRNIRTEGEKLYVQAGALLSHIAAEALRQGLTGFEFAAGIPGTLGGACAMNAGAYGGEMKDVLEEITLLDENREICTKKTPELELGYRSSRIAIEGLVVLSAALRLRRGEVEQIRAKMQDLKERRMEKQPLEYPSAGSTFKRPEGHFAGKLIEDAGLKGFAVGDAQVSEKHCGFVINRGEATARDIVELMDKVSETVWEKFQVRLEPEVKRIGEF